MGHKPPKGFNSKFEIPEMPLPDLAAGNPEDHEDNWCWRHFDTTAHSWENEESLEEIVVTGIRASHRSAIDRKKLAGTSMDSLVAEDIGVFPDKNVAEALQRITGVQLSRDFGEGNSVSIRGIEPDLVRVEVNGVSALGHGGNRGVDFRDMASELVKSLDVIKGSEARLTEARYLS